MLNDSQNIKNNDQIPNEELTSSDSSRIISGELHKNCEDFPKIPKSSLYSQIFSLVLVIILTFWVSNIYVSPFRHIDDQEFFLSIVLFMIVISQEMFRCLRYNSDKIPVYTKRLLVISCIWFCFNVFFYFRSFPLFLVIFLLLGMASVLFPYKYPDTVKNLLNNAFENDFEKHSEYIPLLSLSTVSMLCIFTILKITWAVIIPLCFFVIVLKTIDRFEIPDKVAKAAAKSKIESSWYKTVTIYYNDHMLKSLGAMTCLGAMIFQGFVTVYPPPISLLSLRLQLSLWGVFIWCLIADEINFYAYKQEEKLITKFGEN